MDLTDLRRFIDEVRSRHRGDGRPIYDWMPTVSEPERPPWERRLTPCPPPDLAATTGSVADARRLVRRSVRDYLDDPFPDCMLLVRAMPGIGKTTAAVEIVEEIAAAGGKRIAYYGPRHDFFQDILDKSGDSRLWYEWLPRQAGDADSAQTQTCAYPDQINAWMQRGYDAMPFCSQICGWQYVKKSCPYHAQARTTAPVIFAQHNHVTGGHPLPFAVAFGDENPLTSFLREWKIPSRWVLPPGMDHDEPLAELLSLAASVAGAVPDSAEGPELIDMLGGPQEVIAACESFQIPAGLLDQTIRSPEDAAKAPYAHLVHTVPLLLREARLAATGKPYPHRIILAQGHMTLLLRRRPASLPPHVVWLDATGSQHLYQAAFGRPVKLVEAGARLQGSIYQVVDRANGKTAAQHAKRGADLAQLVREISSRYERPAVIGFKAFVETADLNGSDVGHFYAARGTNAHEDADAVIVAGAPQADIYDIVKMAKMLYFERDEAFRPEWTTREQPYAYVAPDGQGRAYPISGFWADPDLQAVLETLREDEILQSAHRGRPVNKPTDIWLLTNIPIGVLPPTELLTAREVIGAPKGVNVYRWNDVARWLETVELVTVKLLQDEFELNYETASRYLDIIETLPGWERASIKSQRGKPTRQAKKS